MENFNKKLEEIVEGLLDTQETFILNFPNYVEEIENCNP